MWIPFFNPDDDWDKALKEIERNNLIKAASYYYNVDIIIMLNYCDINEIPISYLPNTKKYKRIKLELNYLNRVMKIKKILKRIKNKNV